jgi:hypothetical protein
MSPDLCVVSARPVSVSRNGKIKARKRKANALSTLGTVTGFVYPGGNAKLMKDATTDPFAKKRRKKKVRRRNPKAMTKSQLLNAIDAAYDSDEPKLVQRLEAELRRRFPVKLRRPSSKRFHDPLADTGKLFGVENAKKRRKKKVKANKRKANRKPKANRRPKAKANRRPKKRVNRKPRKVTRKRKSTAKRSRR